MNEQGDSAKAVTVQINCFIKGERWLRVSWMGGSITAVVPRRGMVDCALASHNHRLRFVRLYQTTRAPEKSF